MSEGVQLLATAVIAAVAGVCASSGFWAYLMRRSERKDAIVELVLGIAHEQIVTTGMRYLDRGWITTDELDDYIKYLWRPYEKHGGNGITRRVVDEVKELPVKSRYSSFTATLSDLERNVLGLRQKEDDQ